jgi:hypothetical protein
LGIGTIGKEEGKRESDEGSNMSKVLYTFVKIE